MLIIITPMLAACLDGAEVSASRLKFGRSPFHVSPKTNFSIMIKLPIKSTGEVKPHSDSTLKRVDYLRGIKYLHFSRYGMHIYKQTAQCNVFVCVWN